MKITKRFVSALSHRSVDTMSPNELAKVLELASKHYFTKEQPILTDSMYDFLKDHLALIDPQHAYLSQVGHRESVMKVELPFWMGSMNKIKHCDTDALRKWTSVHGSDVHVSDKLDGVSALYVRHSSTHALYTRGDGRIGRDITWMLSYIMGLSAMPDDVAVRGELVISKRSFQQLVSRGVISETSNARNVVSGVVNSKRPTSDILRSVEFVAYEYISDACALTPIEQANMLGTMGVLTVPCVRNPSVSMESLYSLLLRRKCDGPYEIDGLVVSKNAKNIRNTSGNPTYAFAFKSESDISQVEVTHVAWNLSKDKFFKPVIHFHPTYLSGVTVRKATGVSAKFIVDNRIGEGAIVTVTRSGEVIPKVVHILKPSANVKLPEQPYIWTESKVDIVQMGDTSESEFKQFEAMIICLSIKGLQGGTLRRLFENGVGTLKSLFALELDDLLGLHGFQVKSATTLIDNIRIAKETLTIEKVMHSSNLMGRGIGIKTIQAILERHPTALSGCLRVTDLTAIHGIEVKTAERFISNVPKLMEFLKANMLERLVVQHESGPVEMDYESTKFRTMRFVFSGVRDAGVAEYIRKHGGVIDDAVTKKTTHLITPEHAIMTCKMQKAIRNGVTMVHSKNVMFD